MKIFFLPKAFLEAPDTHHMVDDTMQPEEYENQSAQIEREAMWIDERAELALIQQELN